MPQQSLKTRIESAISLIVHMNTLPPQIDYVSPQQKHETIEAQKLIDSMPLGLRNHYYTRINSAIEAYYTPNFKGEDGNVYSIAELDAMF